MRISDILDHNRRAVPHETAVVAGTRRIQLPVKVGVMLTGEQRDIPAEARWAERRGFDHVACGEHLFFHTATPNAFVALGAAAGATERIRLLTSLAITPLYSAVLLTKLATTLDLVSGGRLDLGLGVGGEFPAEFVAAGVDVRERGARTDETLAVMTALWTGEPVTFTGRSVHVPGLQLDPQPVQAPRPPLWMGGRRGGCYPPGRQIRRCLDAVPVHPGSASGEPGPGACGGGALRTGRV